ncbi:hypothetical protein GCM10027271_18150 [Saccharopolyspora gloriosae]|uniref:Uncharacterized protein n=1 Tax=Saccharopolyspora gloriosae TaxID=455344 RepID=A0A840NB53_9PSEU|nr:hypothetical protein [Saccharopolyspora gloriosae]MBB5067365.1 hypothetical protein [Saccharopolyspora gloriosae]
MLSGVESSFLPHLAAIRASVRAGFRFQHVPSRGEVLSVHGFRASHGAMDTYVAHDRHDATAARYRLADLDRGTPQPLWQRHGNVADVVTELLELPPHGAPGAPGRTGSASALWLPSHVVA